MQDTIVIERHADTNSARASIAKRLLETRKAMETSFYDFCVSLLDAKEAQLHLEDGFARFTDWAVQQTDLDISERQTMYYLNIARKCRQLGLTAEVFASAKISKLKDIFSLDPETHGEEMKALVAAAKDSSSEDIKKAVRALKGDTSDAVYMTLKLDPLVKETVEEAMELARMNYGSVVREGEVADPSNSQAMELIAVSYINDPNNHREEK